MSLTRLPPSRLLGKVLQEVEHLVDHPAVKKDKEEEVEEDLQLDAQPDMDLDQLEALRRVQATKKQDRYREGRRMMTILSCPLVGTVTAEEVHLGLTEHKPGPSLELLSRGPRFVMQTNNFADYHGLHFINRNANFSVDKIGEFSSLCSPIVVQLFVV